MSEDRSNQSLEPIERGDLTPSYGQNRDLIYDPRLAYHGAAPQPSDEIDLIELIGTLFKRKFLILAFALLGAIAGLLIVLQSTPLFRAEAKIEVQKQETQIVEGSSVEPAIIADAEFMETQYALLKSRSLAERVVLLLGLDTRESFADQELSRDLKVQQATGHLLENLNVGPEGRSRVIKVGYVDADPAIAATITNTLIDNFIETTMERKFNTTAYARNFLQERLAQAKTTLEDTERKLVAYAEEFDILELKESGQQTNLVNNALLRLSEELGEAQSERIIAEQAYLELVNSPATLEILQSEDLRRLRATRSELAAEYQDLLGTFKPDYPDLVKLKSRIDAIDAELGQETQAIINAAEASFRSATARETIIRTNLEGLKNELRSLRNRSVDYTILQREVDTAGSQYDALLQRLKEVSMASGIGSSQISVVDTAIVPNAPFSPNIPLTLALSVMLGGGLGVGLAFLLTFMDDRIKTPEDIKQKLRVAVIGVIPKVKANGKDDLILEELKDPKSGVSEAYFSARTALEFASDTGVPKSILVTSTQPAEGKTSTSVALASAFARIGKQVLIIDADMRKPSFVADGESSIGLSGLLSKGRDLQENIIYSESTGLYLLPSGVIPPNPAELLSGQRLKDIIKEAEEHFDVVIVDAPPMLNFTDGPVLGTACRGALVVFKSGNIRTPAGERTIERLRENRVNVIGAVLSHFDAKKAGYDYNYYYYAYGAGAENYGNKQLKDKRESSRRKVRLFAGDDADL